MDPWEAVFLVIATIGSVGAAVGAWFQERHRSTTHLAAVQRKLELIMDHLGIAEPVEPEVVRHLENGRMIHAVRAYRKQTGTSLVEAKQAVDRIASNLHLER
ncbi:hypothetical protein ACQPWW_14115 [Micromonospora sp. CA-240977]|uniref:hypothetical protein n=1 Tax=Micromonospora sp. CA-240977 TaxID=3239957 RepID=UPI003D919F52